ncbi:MAG: hypothetical protein AB7P76_10345 [Candidatus Melainabacteria bacterium]
MMRTLQPTFGMAVKRRTKKPLMATLRGHHTLYSYTLLPGDEQVWVSGLDRQNLKVAMREARGYSPDFPMKWLPEGKLGMKIIPAKWRKKCQFDLLDGSRIIYVRDRGTMQDIVRDHAGNRSRMTLAELQAFMGRYFTGEVKHLSDSYRTLADNPTNPRWWQYWVRGR